MIKEEIERLLDSLRKVGRNMAVELLHNFQYWKDHEGKEEVEKLQELFDHETLTDKDLRAFVKLIKKNSVFGTVITSRVDAVETFALKNGEEVVKITATVQELTPEGYVNCPHPLNQYDEWIVTSIIFKNRFEHHPQKMDLFQTSYDIEQNPKHRENIISIRLSSYREIEESFESSLRAYGGDQLVKVAYEKFGDDVEKTIVGRLAEGSKLIKKELTAQKEAIEKENQQTIYEIEELVKEKEAKVRWLEDQHEALSEKEKTWETLLTKIKQFARLDDEIEIDKQIEKVSEWKPHSVIGDLQSLIYFNSGEELLYESDIIEAIMRGIQSDILVILSGPSGTGKSSIVQAIGDSILDAQVRMIPVQSSWTDTQDLLGYFNPIDKSYVASPFMEALAEANKHQDKLYFICLDEMNLAHIEYYFSEFLSARESKNPSIRLYSKKFFLQAKHFIEQYDETVDNYIDFMNASELVHDYPYLFEIPRNVRFFGTLNMDHTVKPLSPKVIDRSLIIEMDHITEHDKDEIKKKIEQNKMSGCVDVSVEEFEENHIQLEVAKKDVNKLMDLSLSLKDLPNVLFNSRAERQLIEYISKYQTTEEVLDQLIYAKLLPRIEVSQRDEQAVKDLHAFSEKIVSYKRSADKLTKMMQNEPIIRFW